MPFELSDRSVLVTGASSGIGAAVAVEVARRGARVGIVARRETELAAVLERCRRHTPGSQMWVGDLADTAQADAMIDDLPERLGGVDVLINNAGIPKRRHVTRLTPGEVDAVMRINYLTPVRLALALLPAMMERGEGRIVNVASVAAVLSSPGESAYNASKAALAVWSETADVDLDGTGVRVHVVHPGVVDTPLFDVPDNDDLANPVDPIPVEDAAAAVLEPLESDALITYVPDYFADLARAKADDPEGFLEGVAEWVREERGDRTARP
ncbi:MAG: SDR family oxidoreductase [Acidimicrobiia bacterium]